MTALQEQVAALQAASQCAVSALSEDGTRCIITTAEDLASARQIGVATRGALEAGRRRRTLAEVEAKAEAVHAAATDAASGMLAEAAAATGA